LAVRHAPPARRGPHLTGQPECRERHRGPELHRAQPQPARRRVQRRSAQRREHRHLDRRDHPGRVGHLGRHDVHQVRRAQEAFLRPEASARLKVPQPELPLEVSLEVLAG
jgi:hypothetical protein